MWHAKNKIDKSLITRKVAVLLFGLKYLTFSFNLIRIQKVVSNMFSRLKEINLNILEEHYPKRRRKKNKPRHLSGCRWHLTGLQQFCNQMMSPNKISGVDHKLCNIELIWSAKSRDLTYIVQANFTMCQTKIYKHHNSIVLTLRINSKFVCSLIKQKYHHAPNHHGLRT
jgi:hypothetical protein